MSNMFLASAALAIVLATSSVAVAAMPSGIGQTGGAVRIGQSTNGVEAIHWRRHHNRNGFRLFFGQQRYCDNFRSQFNSDRCRFQHRGRNHPGIYFNSNDGYGYRDYQPDFGFSIGF